MKNSPDSPKQTWKKCTQCNIFICTSDTNIHERYCIKTRLTENLATLPHGYIRKGIFHASIEVKSGKDPPLLPSWKLSLILMHPSVMEMFGFVKGGYVLMCSSRGQIVFRSWPCSTVKMSSVLLPGFNMFQHYMINHITIQNFLGPTDHAGGIVLIPKIYKHFMATKAFKVFILKQIEQLYVKVGIIFTFTFLGCLCEMTVSRIVHSNSNDPVCTMSKICDAFGNLNVGNKLEDFNFDEHELSRTHSMKPLSCSTPLIKKNSVSNTFCATEYQKPKAAEINYVNSSQGHYLKIVSSTSITIEYLKHGEETHSSNIKFENIGGLTRQISEIKHLLATFLDHKILKNAFSIPRSVLISGPQGTGKSLVISAIQNEYKYATFAVTTSRILNRFNETGEQNLKRIFTEAIESAPSIIIIDNIDTFCNDKSESAQKIINSLSALINELQSSSHKVFIIATTSKSHLLDPKLMKHGVIEKEIKFDIPSSTERKEIFYKLLYSRNNVLSEDQILELSESTQGFTGADIERLCKKVELLALLRRTSVNIQDNKFSAINFDDIKKSLRDITPKAVMEFYFEKPKVKWSDIGGMKEVKRAITEMVEWPLKHSEQFLRFKITPSRGILMYGPPGCSKTMIAKALAFESQLNFIPIKGPQLFNKYVGESENAVSELFKKAREAAPCIIFFDEIDSLASKRGSVTGNSNVGDRVLTQLLIEIDGIDVLKGVSIIAATNRPDMIDPSLLRPGRFDRRIYVPLPDSLTRKEIFNVKLSKMPLAKDVDISYLVDETDGYTGAEIDDICREAVYQMSPWKFHLEESEKKCLRMSHFQAALSVVTRRTTQDTKMFYENYNTKNIL